MKLVEDWKQAWRWISVNCMVLASVLQGAWLYVPEDLRQSLPHGIVHILTIAILALGVVGKEKREKVQKIYNSFDSFNNSELIILSKKLYYYFKVKEEL